MQTLYVHAVKTVFFLDYKVDDPTHKIMHVHHAQTHSSMLRSRRYTLTLFWKKKWRIYIIVG